MPEYERSTVVKWGLFALVFFIAIAIVATSWQPASASVALRDFITRKCIDWRNERCSEESAYTIQVDTDRGTKTLAELCEQYHNVQSGQFPQILDKCRGLCEACDQFTSV